jgi:hypothetical protein
MNEIYNDPQVANVGLFCDRNFRLLHMHRQVSPGRRCWVFERDDVKRGGLSAIMCDVKSILRLGGGANSERLLFTTRRSVHIASSVKLIRIGDFSQCALLYEVTFSTGSCSRGINGFDK